MKHLCVSKLTTIGSDNGLSPGRRQAIIWTNPGILLIEPSGTNFSEILIETHTFSFKKIRLKMLSGKRRPFCLSLNVLRQLFVQASMCQITPHPVMSYLLLSNVPISRIPDKFSGFPRRTFFSKFRRICGFHQCSFIPLASTSNPSCCSHNNFIKQGASAGGRKSLETKFAGNPEKLGLRRSLRTDSNALA